MKSFKSFLVLLTLPLVALVTMAPGPPSIPVSNKPYGAEWNGKNSTAPSQNAVYDKIQTIVAGYTNLTSFVDQTAWRVFYSDGSGDVKELALGSDGTYLRSNGASSAPTFDTPSGSGGFAITGTIAASGDATNFPAANAGEWYQVSSAGWLGGAAGIGEYSNIGDLWYCNTTASSGTLAVVGGSWNHYRHIISQPDGYRSVEIASNTSAPTITNGYYWLNNVMYKVENSVHTPVNSNVYETIFIPASAMTPTATNGAAAGSTEFATNDINMEYLAFDTTTEEYAEFQFPMPEGWDRSTIKMKAYWAPGTASGAVGDTVEWEIACGALSNSDTIDAALGTSQVISDAVVTGENASLHVSGATPAITCGGTPTLWDMIHFKVSRNVGGTDNHGYDAWLFGVWVQYKVINAVAGW